MKKTKVKKYSYKKRSSKKRIVKKTNIKKSNIRRKKGGGTSIKRMRHFSSNEDLVNSLVGRCLLPREFKEHFLNGVICLILILKWLAGMNRFLPLIYLSMKFL